MGHIIYKSISFLLFLSLSLFGQTDKIDITQLEEDFYIYTTYNFWNGKIYPSNSMYVLTTEGVVMIDTPWHTELVQPILDSIEQKHQKKVILYIATHSHDDRMLGLKLLKEKGIKTYSYYKTDSLRQIKSEERTEFVMTKDTVFTVANHNFEIYYPGAGHTSDNIVIWFSKEKILYGGCLVKSVQAQDLGYIGESNLSAWPNSIKKLIKKYPNPKYIIPGHMDWINTQSLQHTLNLLKKHQKKEK